MGWVVGPFNSTTGGDTLNTNREELAWVAGFLDGEGSFQVNKRESGRRDWRISIQITQVNREVLDKAARILGIGQINGPYAPKGISRLPQHRFYINGFERVQSVVARLWPWLGSIKRAQAKQALLTWRAA